MRITDLYTGMPLLVQDTGGIIEGPIDAIEGGPKLPNGVRPVHAGMIVRDFLPPPSRWERLRRRFGRPARTVAVVPVAVLEMTWPRLRWTEAGAWFAGRWDAWVCPLVNLPANWNPAACAGWWNANLGHLYSIPELLAMIPWYLRIPVLSWLFKPSPWLGMEVCSEADRLAWAAGGLGAPSPLSPAAILAMPFVGKAEQIAA